jgi:putative ABC transport system permease protein
VPTDLRFALRQLARHPGFAAVAILTLAFGIGANAVVFGIARTLLWRPLGFVEEDRLAWVRWSDGATGGTRDSFSWTDLEDLRGTARSFVRLALVSWPGVRWEHPDQPQDLTALTVSPELVDVLRISPVLGRPLLASDAAPGAAPVALISHEFWQARFAGDAAILGQTLRLDGQERTIVGVLPPRLEFPVGYSPNPDSGNTVFSGRHDVWLPLIVTGPDRTGRGNRMFQLVGRLGPGVRAADAGVELEALGRRWAAEFPDTNDRLGLSVLPLRHQVLGPARHHLRVLAAAVIGVLLVCCVNLANLLLARGIAREREMSVRRALGASRRRIVAGVLTECLALAVAGGVGAACLAGLTLRLLRRFGPSDIPFLAEIGLDAPTLAFVAALSCATGLCFGVLPAWRQSTLGAADALRSGVRTTAGPRFRRWQQGLLVGQIAVVLLLLASAMLLLGTVRRLLGLDLGYQPGSVIAMNVSTRDLPTNEDNVRLYREIHARLAALPGIEAAGAIQAIPLNGGWTWEERAQAWDRPLPVPEQPLLAVTFVAFDYFEAMRIPVVEGRRFQASELRDDGYAPVAILNQSAARRLFPGRSALGQRFAIASSPEVFYEVVGVVRDTRDARLELPPQPRFYLLYTHGGSQMVARSSLPADTILPRLRAVLAGFGPRVVLNDIRPLMEIVHDGVAVRRFLARMLALYALLGCGIAAVGIFGVISHQVAQRTTEFGVRLAVGSTPGALARLVVAQTGRVAATGLGLGLLATFATSRLLESHLYGISPQDPVALATASAVLLGLAVLAAWQPARRASRVDPVLALRGE